MILIHEAFVKERHAFNYVKVDPSDNRTGT